MAIRALVTASLFSGVAAGRAVAQAPSGGALTLNALLEEALEQHPLVQAGDARVRAATRARRAAGAFSNPLFAYDLEGGRLPGQSVHTAEREEMLTVMVPLQDLYQRWPRVSRADAEVRVAGAEASRQRLDVLRAASAAFHRAVLAQVTVETTRELHGWLDSLVAYDSVRVDEGVSAEVDLIRSQLERDRVASTLAISEAEWAKAWGELGAYLADGSKRPLAFVDAPIGESMLSAAGSNAAPAQLESRPDVIAARERLAGANAAVSEQRTLLLPSLDLTLGVKEMDGVRSLIAGGSVPLPIFNLNRGETGHASAERDALRFELAHVERAARSDLGAALAATATLTTRVRALSTGFLARAEEARTISFGMYREGAVPLIQLLDALRAWSESHIAYHELLFAQHQSVVDLAVSRGLADGQSLSASIR